MSSDKKPILLGKRDSVVGPPEKKANAQLSNEKWEAVVCHKVKKATILVVGPTGTGKSTFISCLQDPTFVAQQKASIMSDTQFSEMYTMLFQVCQAFYSIDIIDTPGFGDNSQKAKTDFQQEEMILKFVKSGTTSVNRVFIAIRYGARMEQAQVDTMMRVLHFLGPDMRRVTGMLVTHAEGITSQEKRSFVDEIKTSSLKLLGEYCKKKPYFTGMARRNAKPSELDRHAAEASKNISKMISSTVNATPVQIMSPDDNKTVKRFQVHESSSKHSLVLQRLLPTISPMCMKLIEERQKAAALNSAKVDAVLDKIEKISYDDIQGQVAEWSKIQTVLADYEAQGKKVVNSSEEVLEVYNNLNDALKSIQAAFDVNLLEEDAGEGDQEEESEESY